MDTSVSRRILPRVAGGLEIVVWIAGIVIGIGEGIPVIEEEFDRFNGDREPEAFAKGDLHVSNAYNLSTHIEERAAAVTRINLGCGLQVERPLERTCFGAQDAFSHGPFQTERAADSEDSFPNGQGIRAPQ